jgi:hypothetical protein
MAFFIFSEGSLKLVVSVLIASYSTKLKPEFRNNCFWEVLSFLVERMLFIHKFLDEN